MLCDVSSSIGDGVVCFKKFFKKNIFGNRGADINHFHNRLKCGAPTKNL